MALAFIFPGQGSQSVGMGSSLDRGLSRGQARVFEAVDEALGENLSRLMFEGPIEDADIDRKRPAGASWRVSVAAMRALEDEFGVDVTAAKYRCRSQSLGEYSALCAAGALSLDDAAKLLKLRGQSMQKRGSRSVEGAMAALLGADDGAGRRSRVEAGLQARAL